LKDTFAALLGIAMASTHDDISASRTVSTLILSFTAFIVAPLLTGGRYFYTCIAMV